MLAGMSLMRLSRVMLKELFVSTMFSIWMKIKFPKVTAIKPPISFTRVQPAYPFARDIPVEIIRPETHGSSRERRLYEVHSKINRALAAVFLQLSKLMKAN